MKRRAFIRQTCITCVSGGLIPFLITSCQATHYASGVMDATGISVSKSEFTYLKKEQTLTRQYIIVQNDKLEFPIYVYRFSDTEYSALWMKCTHQGAELQASGEALHCPSHGSEFTNKGAVSNGPAEKNLRSFPIIIQTETITIDLRQS
ncbi:MAG TPA: Rieske (2Fe-2S) iron-sulfur domain-containing protein [Cytophagales bacterium]|nr:Rieske (2Fe-2S) iron-sulfur domain-containing protein [Cytophagales bacterium]